VISGDCLARVPNPGTVAERDVIAARQPGFLDAYRAGVSAARAAQCADGAGNTGHTAVQSWCRFTELGLNLSCRRVLDPLVTPLEVKLSEVDLVEAWGWWLFTQVGVNSETAWGYICTANAWHDRYFGVAFAGGMDLARVHKMLQGLQRLTGRPVTRRKRIGVRPVHLRAGIDARFRPASSPRDANVCAAMEVGLVGILRAGELCATKDGMAFSPIRHPSRADVSFEYDALGHPVACKLMVINCKARGANALNRLPVYLPMRGKYLSPGQALYYLTRVADPVPLALAASTPLFRDPAADRILRVSEIRTALRSAMAAIGRDPSVYGAHSLRIGGATALAWLKVPGDQIQAAGRWHSGAYMTYLRETRDQGLRNLTAVAGADTDDFEADFIDIDDHAFDADDDA
jgi:hypothetical protein